MHWPRPPEALRPLDPPQLELDLFDGTAYVGLVPFTMTGVRPVGFPPFGGSRASTRPTCGRTSAWRTAIPASGSSASRPPTAIAVLLARAPVPLALSPRGDVLGARASSSGHRAAYQSSTPASGAGPVRSPASYAIRATPDGPPHPAQPGTLEHFLVERYILYTSRKRGYTGPRPPRSLSSSISKDSLARRNSPGCGRARSAGDAPSGPFRQRR